MIDRSHMPATATELIVRDAQSADMAAVQAIYAHHVLHGLATFEEVPPDLARFTVENPK